MSEEVTPHVIRLVEAERGGVLTDEDWQSLPLLDELVRASLANSDLARELSPAELSPPPRQRIRVREGVYLGLTDAARSAIALVTAIVTLNPDAGLSILKSLAASGLALHGLVNVFVRTSGDARTVFEAVHRRCTTLERVAFDDPTAPPPLVRGDVYGFQGPTTDELVEALAGALSESAVRDALVELQGRRILVQRRHRWYIRV